MLGREWASEKETIVFPARAGTPQFISGSLDNPVSTAGTCGVISPKHSSMASNPDLEPSIPYQGVQMWAGITMQASSISNKRAVMSLADALTVGRPSPFNLELSPANISRMPLTVSNPGAKTSKCTRRGRPPCL